MVAMQLLYRPILTGFPARPAHDQLETQLVTSHLKPLLWYHRNWLLKAHALVARDGKEIITKKLVLERKHALN